MDTRLVTTSQAARFCSVSPDTIRKWIRKGLLRAARTAGGHHRIALRDLEQFVLPQGDPQKKLSKVLVITSDTELTSRLYDEAPNVPFNVRITDCGYDCSLLVGSFKPDYVVLDCSLGLESTREFICHLTQDPRIPDIRILLAFDEDDTPPQYYEDTVHAWMPRPFSMWDIVERVHTLGD